MGSACYEMVPQTMLAEENAVSVGPATKEQNRIIDDAVRRDRDRLRSFIRKRVDDAVDVEDILQDVFYELVETYRLMKPIEQVTAWLFKVARNRIVDFFRKKKPDASTDEPAIPGGGGDTPSIADFLPSPDAGPDAEYARNLLLEELELALGELPEEQRDAFVANELEGRSFKEISAATGIGVNTLISRKHYAVMHLRRRLRDVYEEFG